MSARATVTVVGAGVVGLAVALELARAGRDVQVADDGAPSASAVAAGMLAPASEAVLDGADAALAGALRRARALWERWGERIGAPVACAGALHIAEEAVLAARAAAAARLGFVAERRASGLFLPDDAWIDPAAGLERLRATAAAAGVRFVRARVRATSAGLALDDRRVAGEVVVCAGWGAAGLAACAPELAALAPIRGQLLRLRAEADPGPVLRAPDAYLAPTAQGWIVGATMEAGRADTGVDDRTSDRLRAVAAAVRPELAEAPGVAAVGVRAAAPDALPLVGRSLSGAWLATGLRRNGWLLAPLVAEGVAAYLAGANADDALAGQAAAWSPARVFEREWA